MAWTSLSGRVKSRIGLDVGASGVRAVQLGLSGGCYHLTASGRCGAAQPEVEDAQGWVLPADSIRNCVERGAFSGRDVTVGLNTPNVEFHALDVPELTGSASTDDEAVHREILRLRAEFPGDLETAYWRLPRANAKAPNAIGVVACVDAVNEAVRQCRDASLACQCVDVSAAALSRFGCMLHQWDAECVWGVLDLGQRESRLILSVDDVPVLVRSVGGGGESWTQQIAEALEISDVAAEVQKCRFGVQSGRVGDAVQGGDATANEVTSMLTGALRGKLNDLADEIRRSYQYVMSCYGDRQAGDLVLVGGAARMTNLPQYLSDVLGIDVRRASDYLANDRCRLRFASGKGIHLESLATAIGLARGEG